MLSLQRVGGRTFRRPDFQAVLQTRPMSGVCSGGMRRGVPQRPVPKPEVCCLPGSQTVLFLLIRKSQSLLKSSECDDKKRKYAYPLALSYFVQSLPLEQVRLTHAVCPRIAAPLWGSCPPKSAVPIPMHLYSFAVYVYTLHAVLLCVFFFYCGDICII